MRVVTIPPLGGRDGGVLPASLGFGIWYKNAMLNVQNWLETRGSGLARVRFRAFDGTDQTAASWIEKQAAAFNIKPEWILLVLQSEQSLVRDPKTYSAEYTVKDAKPSLLSRLIGRPSEAVAAPGCRLVKSKGGPVEACGEWKMMAAAGAGIPDPGVTPPWDVKNYLGFDRQVYHVGRMAARDLSDFATGNREVQLYPSDEEKAAAAREGRTPRGEVVLAADPETLVLLKWTPHPDVLVQRPLIYRQLFGA